MFLRFCCVFALAALAAGTLQAAPAKDNNGKQKDKGKSHRAAGSHASATIDVHVVLGEYRRVVSEYVDHQPGGSLPPGLAKRGGDLPPGLAKQLRKNGTLPPGLQKRVSSYPPDLRKRLPELGDDYEGGFLHGRVVIFNKHTSAILDVFIP
jgi:hypothetical protein